MSTERDTHFLGFARLLWDGIIAKLVSLELCIDTASPVWDRLEDYPSQILRDGLDEMMQALIAQHAYDLVLFLFEEVDPLYFDVSRSYHERLGEGAYDYRQFIKQLPDMTERPEQEDPLQGKGKPHE